MSGPSAIDETRVDALIARIDRRIADQLRLIMDHPAVRDLGRTWRGLWLVVSRLAPGVNAVVDMLDLAARELPPPRALTEGYEIAICLHELSLIKTRLLEALGALGLPCVVSVGDPFVRGGDGRSVLLDGFGEGEELSVLRRTVAARELVLTVGDVTFDDCAIATPAAVGALVLSSFADDGWSVNIVDVPVPEVRAPRRLSGATQGRLAALGLVTAVSTPEGATFRSLHGLKEPAYYGDDDDARQAALTDFASSQLPYRLLAQRFVRYLRAIANEHGSEASEAMTRWLNAYIQSADASTRQPFGREPLRGATVRIHHGVLELSLRPAFRLYAPHLEASPFFTIELRAPFHLLGGGTRR